MQEVIEITAPFFGLIFLGTFLKKINFLNEEKTTFLSRFAFYVLMPVMLFSNIAKTSFDGSFDFKFIVKYEFATVIIILFFLLFGLLLKKDLPKSTLNLNTRTYRSISMDGYEIEFSDGFTNLHTESYKNIINGNGFGLMDNLTAIETVHNLRNASIDSLTGDYHPMVKKK